MFLSSLAVAYWSSVVMFSSWPSLMGMSWSPVVFPVRISGPFYKAESVPVRSKRRKTKQTYGVEGNGERTTSLDASGLAGVIDNGLVVLIWLLVPRRGAKKKKIRKETEGTAYLVRAVGEVHANNVQTSYETCQRHDRGGISRNLSVHLRRRLIFSTEFVLGPKEGRKSG